ncbi:unnamed protein product [Brassica rapa]|uniref:Uncharacterized protein n=1 Tax=Brassica campestris TaxID=3711 RepID=A0A8D9HTA8_BRACM|nr:unnamed protein product [Brassica rapa]
MLGSLSWISPPNLLVQCKAYEVVVFKISSTSFINECY